MTRLDSALERERLAGRMALIPFVPAGDPDLAYTESAIRTVAEAGATAIEIGFPFSDPIADGPVIQAAYTRALATGLTVDAMFATLKSITASPGWTTPLVAMASYSLIWRKGLDAFLKACDDSGVCGIVVPDLPVEEAGDFAARCRESNIDLILLVTPTTAPERAGAIARSCSGFVYVVSVVGITGSGGRSAALPELLSQLKSVTDLPRCVGFGIGQPGDVTALRGLADGVIVGTAFVKQLENAGSDRDGSLWRIGELAKALKAAC
jgi:tryptophan synthase alpha chain